MPDSAAKTQTDPGVDQATAAAQPLPSFRALYEQELDFVWRFAAYRGVAPAALEDVVQEVFMVVARELPHFQGRSALRTWIAGITRNVVHSYRRKRGNQSAGEPWEGDDQHASPALGPAEALEHKTAGQLLDLILAKMTELQREAFVLCEVEGLSAVETAEALGINENTLRTRLHDARKVFNAASARLSAERTWSSRIERGKP